MTDTYQDYIPVEGVHPSEDKYLPEQIKYLEKLKKAGITELTVGFATEHDECQLRHVEILYKDPDGELRHAYGNDIPNELDFEIDQNDLHEVLADHDIESLLTFKPGPMEIAQGSSIYITEPELKDDMGGDVAWNYWE